MRDQALMPWREIGKHLGVSGTRARVIGERARRKLLLAWLESGVLDDLELLLYLQRDARNVNRDALAALLPESDAPYARDAQDPNGSLRKIGRK